MHAATSLRVELVVVQIVGSDEVDDILDPNGDFESDGVVDGRPLGHELVFRALLNLGGSVVILRPSRRIFVGYGLVHIYRYATEIRDYVGETIAGDPVSRVTARAPYSDVS